VWVCPACFLRSKSLPVHIAHMGQNTGAMCQLRSIDPNRPHAMCTCQSGQVRCDCRYRAMNEAQLPWQTTL
jgi:hypothetical protein